jgi:hypothetical protein
MRVSDWRGSRVTIPTTLRNEIQAMPCEALGQTDPPLYAIFFVIAGADLNIGLLKTLGVLGVI